MASLEEQRREGLVAAARKLSSERTEGGDRPTFLEGLGGFAAGMHRGLTNLAAPLPGRPTVRETAAEQSEGRTEYVAPGKIGEYLGTMGEYATPALLTGGPKAVPMYGLLPGAASEFAGQQTEGTALEPWARLGAGMLAPMAGQTSINAARRMISPHGGVSPERLALVKRLRDEGVPVSAGQKTGAKGLQYAESESPRMAQFFEDQQEAFSKAVMRRLGVADDIAAPEVMGKTIEGLRRTRDGIIAKTDVIPSPQESAQARTILDDMTGLLPEGQKPPALFRQIVESLENSGASGKTITGAAMNNWRSKLGKLVSGKGDERQQAAYELRKLFDDMAERTLQQSGRSGEFERLREVRGQLRDYIAIEKTMTGASDAAGLGQVSPPLLRSKVAQQGAGEYTTGSRDLGELSRAGTVLMRQPPQSGTAPRMGEKLKAALGPLTNSGAVPGLGLGGITYGLTRDPGLAAGVGGAAAMVPPMMNAAKMSPVGQAYLGNQLVGPGRPILNRMMMAPLAAAMAGQGQ